MNESSNHRKFLCPISYIYPYIFFQTSNKPKYILLFNYYRNDFVENFGARSRFLSLKWGAFILFFFLGISSHLIIFPSYGDVINPGEGLQIFIPYINQMFTYWQLMVIKQRWLFNVSCDIIFISDDQ